MKELLKKIESVAEDCMNIEKDMTVGKGSYSYKAVSDNAVTLRVKKSEKRHGIISIPINQELISTESIKVVKSDGKDGIVYNDVIKLTLRIYDIESDKHIDVEAFGRGLDPGDKGFGKASTYARKYALLNAYKIVTGEDPDADPSKKEEVKSKDEKREFVTSYLEKNVNYCNTILKHWGAATISDLTNDDILNTYNTITKKK